MSVNYLIQSPWQCGNPETSWGFPFMLKSRNYPFVDPWNINFSLGGRIIILKTHIIRQTLQNIYFNFNEGYPGHKIQCSIFVIVLKECCVSHEDISAFQYDNRTYNIYICNLHTKFLTAQGQWDYMGAPLMGNNITGQNKWIYVKEWEKHNNCNIPIVSRLDKL